MQKIISSVDSSRIDYIEIVDNSSLLPVEVVRNEILIALAVYIGRTRLIDNCVVKLPGE